MDQPGCSGTLSGSGCGEYQQRRQSFTRSLQHFHETRGTSFKRLPQIGGQDVDLFNLYNLVTERGGWIKVNRTNGWDELVEEFGLPRETTNGGSALKHIYLRYLDRYEKVHFLGDSGDRHDDEEDVESRHRRWNARAMHTVALTYNHHQHNVNENVRRVSGLSNDLYRPSEYDRLALSLVSPLPNEQDFAINVCTLLSTEGKHTLRLDKCPRLLDYLLAHAGVYNHSSLRILFDEIYGRVRGHNLITFWRDVLQSKDAMDLVDEANFIRAKPPGPPRKISEPSSSPTRTSPPRSSENNVTDVRLEEIGNPSDGILEDKSRIVDEAREAKELAEAEMYERMLAEANTKPVIRTTPDVTSEVTVKKATALKFTADDCEIFNLGREGGTRDYTGQRILQIANILRNLSFNEEAIPVMANSTTLLRFLLLCANSRWSNLHQLGLDMLGNLAPELPLDEAALGPLLPTLLTTITRGIRMSDRFIVLASLELLNKICQREENEEIVTRNFDCTVYEEVCRLLSLHDIMILLYTLECLYSMSSMGERPCNYICRAKGALQMLLSLISVEAQTYGPKACILMRVIETVSGGSASTTTQPTSNANSPNPSATSNPVPNVTLQTASGPASKIVTPTQIIRTPSPKTVLGMPMGAVATPVSMSSSAPTAAVSSATVIVTTPAAASRLAKATTVQVAPHATTVAIPATTTNNTNVTQQQHLVQQTAQESEQFALAWIRANYELSAGGRVEQLEMYRLYVDACGKVGLKPGITAPHFPRIVRSVFGGTVGPKQQPIVTDAITGATLNQSVYEGIQVREVPLTINIKLVPVATAEPAAPAPAARRRPSAGAVSPILKAQLVSPLPNNIPSQPAIINPHHHNIVHPHHVVVSCASSLVSATTTNAVNVTSTVAAGSLTNQVSATSSQVSSCIQEQGTSSSSSSSTPSTVSLPPPDMGNSNLIKSLLASKVTQRQARLQAQNSIGKITRINGIVQDSSSVTNSISADSQPNLTVNATKSQPRPLTRVEPEDSDSMASSSRDFPSTGGGVVSSDNDNSLTSFEGIFLNGIDLEATVAAVESKNLKNSSARTKMDLKEPSKDVREGPKDATREGLKEGSREGSKEDTSSPPKKSSLMLAELLDRPDIAINGFIGEKGLELVEKAILSEKPTTGMNNGALVDKCGDTGRTSGSVVTNIDGRTAGVKRTGSGNADEVGPQEKRPRIGDGDREEEEGERTVNGEGGDDGGEVRASSKAANLFAALAAEALEDEEPEQLVDEMAAAAVAPPSSEVTETSGRGAVVGNLVATPEQTSQPQMRPVFLDQSATPIVVQTPSGTRQLVTATTGQQQQQQIVQLTLNPSAAGTNVATTSAATATAQTLPVMLQNQRLQQYIMSAGGAAGQPVLLTTAGQGGQPQTVLVTQTSQQQGTGAKTIIILQPQAGGVAPATGQKLLLASSAGGAVVVGRPITDAPAGSAALIQQSGAATAPATEVSITQNGGQVHVVRGAVAAGGPATVAATNSVVGNATEGIQIIASGVQNNAPCLVVAGNEHSKVVAAPSATATSNPTLPSDHLLYLCEWRACMRSFKSASEVYLHVCSCHCPVDPEQETQCLWSRCDGMKRKRFSLMTHLYDRHCNADVLNMMAARRKQMSNQGRNEIQQSTPNVVPHPGYAPNAALDAIKRHAGEFINPKELMQQQQQQQQQHQKVQLAGVVGGSACIGVGGVKPTPNIVATSTNSAAVPTPPASAILLAKAAATPPQVKDDNEGPVTKSIRLTASLILRNLVNYSSLGRRFLRGFESHLANIALSNVESSRTIAQVLADLNDPSNAR